MYDDLSIMYDLWISIIVSIAFLTGNQFLVRIQHENSAD